MSFYGSCFRPNTNCIGNAWPQLLKTQILNSAINILLVTFSWLLWSEEGSAVVIEGPVMVIEWPVMVIEGPGLTLGPPIFYTLFI